MRIIYLKGLMTFMVLHGILCNGRCSANKLNFKFLVCFNVNLILTFLNEYRVDLSSGLGQFMKKSLRFKCIQYSGLELQPR